MIMELLCPAGNEEALVAAVQNGADAVYLGGRALGARASASNFFGAGLEKAVSYCHMRGTMVYMTVNTLVKESEIEDGVRLVEEAVHAGVDAFLVQDLGFANLLQEAFPGICLHASTQMSINNADGAKMAMDMGLSRVVAARECTLSDIREMAKTGAEIEVFAHGALCMGFSGQCLFSSAIGGRSGNRGRCAQPCRLPYTLNGKKSYALSTRDLCTIYDLRELMNSGACSIKLEGRLKRPEYVAIVTGAYRRALDLAFEGRIPGPEEFDDLLAVFNRGGFTRGYAFGQRDDETLFQERPNHQGVHVGTIRSIGRGQGTAKLTRPLHEGDGLEARLGAKGVGISVSGLKQLPDGLTQFRLPMEAKGGMELYRTTDAKQMERARESYAADRRKRRVSMKAELRIGQTAKLWLDGLMAEGEPVQAARGKPLLCEQVEKQLLKLGDTPFVCEQAEIFMDENVFLPLSALNALRRQAADALEKQILEQAKPKVECRKIERLNGRYHHDGSVLLVHQSQEVDELLASPADELYWQAMDLRTESLRTGLKRLNPEHSFLVLPPYLTQAELEEIDSVLGDFVKMGVVVNNLSQAKRFCGRKLRAGEGLNAFNPHTAARLYGLGMERVCASTELSLSQARSLAKFAPVELVVYGPQTLMCMRSCPIRAQKGLGDKGRERCKLCGGVGTELIDRKGERLRMLPYRTENGCTLFLQSARTLNAFDRIAVEELKPFAAVKVIGSGEDALYVRATLDGKREQAPLGEFTAGALSRGVE